jgi:hypothetical protein
MSHVNLMTDTIIANLPSDGLRTVLRAILVSNPDITPVFERHVKTCLELSSDRISESGTTTQLENSIALSRVMLGCGMWPQSLKLIRKILRTVFQNSEVPTDILSSVDGDLIQAVTAIEKTQSSRALNSEESKVVKGLYEDLLSYRTSRPARRSSPDLNRSFKAIARLTGHAVEDNDESGPIATSPNQASTIGLHNIETFDLDDRKLPRLFTGLWQLSSPSWGVASHSQMSEQFLRYADSGFTAYDMADHYGDAELLYVQYHFRHPELVYLLMMVRANLGRNMHVERTCSHRRSSVSFSGLKSLHITFTTRSASGVDD